MLLSVENMSVAADANGINLKILDDVSFALSEGEILGVVGESGAGKTTVGHAVIGLLERSLSQTSGSIIFKGTDIAPLSKAERGKLRGRQIGMIFQDPQTALDPVMTIGKQLVETIRSSHGCGKSEATKRALNILSEVGFQSPEAHMQSYPHQLSGGMRQRVVIALVLSAEPALIIADEPTTALDVTLQSQVLQLIRAACKRRGVGVLLVTHNMGVISEIADRVMVMRFGKVVEIGQTVQVLGAPREAYSRDLISAVPRMEAIKNEAALQGVREAALSSPAVSAIPVLTVEDLSVDLGDFRAVSNVSFSIRRRETIGIVGESGSGKSTLARCIAGIYKPAAGTLKFSDQLVSKSTSASKVQMIFQDPFTSLNPRMRVGDIISEAPRFFGTYSSRSSLEQAISAILDRVGLPANSVDRYPHQFSGGQRQRIGIARSLILRPQFLICDEPTSALDVSVQAEVLALLGEVQSEYDLSILFISHDLAVVRKMCSSVLVMHKGSVVEQGPIQDVFDRPAAEYTRTLLNAMPRTDKLAPLAA